MIAEPKPCLNCSNRFRGRTDKKFCSDRCRNMYNNRRSNLGKTSVRFINFHLRKNRRVLEKAFLYAHAKKPVTKSKFIASGFHFKYFTHQYADLKGKRFVFCYEYGYRLLPNDHILIIRQHEKGEEDV